MKRCSLFFLLNLRMQVAQFEFAAREDARRTP